MKKEEALLYFFVLSLGWKNYGFFLGCLGSIFGALKGLELQLWRQAVCNFV